LPNHDAEREPKTFALKIARTMLSNGFEIKVIAECTGLSIAEVEQLQKTLSRAGAGLQPAPERFG
jgi:predicted transposase YdaD